MKQLSIDLDDLEAGTEKQSKKQALYSISEDVKTAFDDYTKENGLYRKRSQIVEALISGYLKARKEDSTKKTA